MTLNANLPINKYPLLVRSQKRTYYTQRTKLKLPYGIAVDIMNCYNSLAVVPILQQRFSKK